MRATEPFVLDASALGKRIGEEEHTAAFNAWYERMLAESADFLAPHLLRYELGAVMLKARGTVLPAPERTRILGEALLGIRFADGGGVFDFAPPLSYYDAAYLSLARSVKGTLVTYDSKLLAAAKKARIRTMSPGK